MVGQTIVSRLNYFILNILEEVFDKTVSIDSLKHYSILLFIDS